jgi:acyl-CoA thioester hydrolase
MTRSIDPSLPPVNAIEERYRAGVNFDPIDPSTSTSITEFRVRFCETDLMGIVHHANYLVYFELGRVEWLRKRGVTYAEWASRGVHLPVVAANATYMAPLKFDDHVTMKTVLTELRAASMKFGYELHRDGTRVAEGWTRLACIDERHRPFRVPDYMRDVLLAAERA